MTRVCAFYSKGRSFLDVLDRVRAAYPGAHVTAMAPATYAMPEAERMAADDVIVTEQARYSMGSPGPFFRLMRQIRRERFDVFVITFDSPRLRILAALSGAARCAYCSMDRQVVPIGPTVPGTLAATLARNVWGRLAYRWIWLAVRLCKVNATSETSHQKR
jgi:hypothetical protein